MKKTVLTLIANALLLPVILYYDFSTLFVYTLFLIEAIILYFFLSLRMLLLRPKLFFLCFIWTIGSLTVLVSQLLPLIEHSIQPVIESTDEFTFIIPFFLLVISNLYVFRYYDKNHKIYPLSKRAFRLILAFPILVFVLIQVPEYFSFFFNNSTISSVILVILKAVLDTAVRYVLLIKKV